MQTYIYMGTADDVVRRYPWNHSWNQTSINNQLIHSVIYDTRLVINDGYIIANPEFLPALKNLNKSLLGNVLLSGSTVLFCRGASSNLAAGLAKSSEHLNTHQQAFSGESGKNLYRQLETLQKYMQPPVQWPTDKNTSAVFVHFLEALHRDEGLRLALSDDALIKDFISIYAEFIEDMDANFNQARQHWERLCWRKCGSLDVDQIDLHNTDLRSLAGYDRVKKMMHVANEAYHMAYASCMNWSLKHQHAIHDSCACPMTAFCPAYLDVFHKQVLADEENIRFDHLGELLITVNFLKLNSDADYSWIRDLVLNDEIVEIRQRYIEMLGNYMSYRCDFEKAVQVATEYRKALASLVRHSVPTYTDIAESLFGFFGGSQVISAFQAIDGLKNSIGIASPVNIDPVKSVKQFIEVGEVDGQLARQGLESIRFCNTKTVARDLGLVSAQLDFSKVETILKPIKAYDSGI